MGLWINEFMYHGFMNNVLIDVGFMDQGFTYHGFMNNIFMDYGFMH